MKIRTLDDFDVKGKTVLLRVDMNVPIDPDTKQITGNKRIEEAKIAGITPAVFIFNGRCEDSPP